MSSRAIEAGRAFLKLTIDDNEFRKGLNNSLRKLDSFGKSVTKIGAGIAGLGAAITAPLAASVKMFSDVGSALNDMADRTGLSVESLSELKFAAEQTGTSLESVERAVAGMQRALQSASQGNGAAAESFKQLGLSARDLLNLSPDQQFEKIATALAGVENPTTRAALAMKVLGKGGRDILPLIKDMDALRERAHELGLTMSAETAANADMLGDAIDTLKASVTNLAINIGAQLAPEVTKIAGQLTGSTKQILDWVKANGELVVSAGTLGVGLTALGAVLTGVGLAASGAAKGVTAFKASLSLIIAHPVIAGVAAATAGFVGLAAAIEGLEKPLASSDDSMEGLIKQLEKANTEAAEFAKLTEGDRTGMNAAAADLIDHQIARIKTQIGQQTLAAIGGLALAGMTPAVNPNATSAGRKQGPGLLSSEKLNTLFPTGLFNPFELGAQLAHLLPRQRRGKPGFTAPGQVLGELAEGGSSRSTFNAQLAEQIFGGGRGSAQERTARAVEVVRDKATRMADDIRRIANRGGDAAIRFGPG